MWWARVENMLKKYGAFSEAEASAPDRPCAGKHTEHLCSLAARADFSKVAASAGKPGFVCMNCGRVADGAHSLCNPIAFDKIAAGIPHVG